MDQVEGGYVGWDARPGDVIRFEGKNQRVEYTSKNYVGLKPSTNEEGDSFVDSHDEYAHIEPVSYEALVRLKAYYVARLIPVRTPQGETR